MDGNFQRTMERRLAACDSVFLLDYPVEVCLAGVESRIGRNRPDMPWVEQEFDPEFRQFVENFATVSLPKIYALLDAWAGKREIVIFKSRAEADAYLDAMRREGREGGETR